MLEARSVTRRFDPVMLVIGSLLLLAQPATHAARGLGTHEHGRSTLEIVMEDGVVQASLRGPAANFYGFERSPQTEAEREAVVTARAILANPERLFVWDEEAACELVSSAIDLPGNARAEGPEEQPQGDADGIDDHHDGDRNDLERHGGHRHEEHHQEQEVQGHHDHGTSSHAEVSAEWTWACDAGVGPDQVMFRIHEAFPATEVVDLTMLAADGAVILVELEGSGQRVRP